MLSYAENGAALNTTIKGTDKIFDCVSRLNATGPVIFW